MTIKLTKAQLASQAEYFAEYKPFKVWRCIDGHAIARAMQERKQNSPVDLSHMNPEIDRWREHGYTEDMIAEFASREEAEADAAARPERFGYTYYAAYCDITKADYYR